MIPPEAHKCWDKTCDCNGITHLLWQNVWFQEIVFIIMTFMIFVFDANDRQFQIGLR